jgi:ubiquinone/menaquinone biosynthesis C-methylase UbiE
MFHVVPSVEGQAVLEAGCSDGLVSDIVALCGADKVVGIDVMETVGCGFPHDHRVDYRVMDIARMDFSDQTFDLVYSIATFEHLPNPYQALGMLRVTKLGGTPTCGRAFYHSRLGHHMFEYFQDYPWIHPQSKDEIIATPRSGNRQGH